MGAIAQDGTLRSGATTTSFVASTAFTLLPSQSHYDLQFAVTKGSATLLEYYIEATSDNGTTWFTLTGGTGAVGYTAATGVTLLKPKNTFTMTCADLGTTDAFVVTHARGAYSKYRLQVRSTGDVATAVAIVIRKFSGAT